MNRCPLAAVLVALSFACPHPGGAEESHDLTAWQQLPVLQNGRVMPMDSYARQLLLSFSGRSTFDRKPAAEWLLRTLFTPDEAREDAVFLVNNPEVLEALGLKAEGRGRYRYAQLQPVSAELARLVRAVAHLEDDARSPVETELMQLYNNLDTYGRLRQGMDFALPRPEFAVTDARLRGDLELAVDETPSFMDLRPRADRISRLLAEIRTLAPEQRTPYHQELSRLSMALRMSAARRAGLPPLMLPGPDARATGSWISPWAALLQGQSGAECRDDVESLHHMAKAIGAGQYAAFAAQARALAKSVHRRLGEPALERKIRQEVLFNRVDPFYRAEVLYGLAFLMALLCVSARGRWLYQGALVLTGLGGLLHAYGIAARMLIMGRPPVTNLYATFLFVAWTCVLIGLAMEFLQRNRLGLITATASGLALLLTAGRFAAEGDTMGVMVAVLDSNFWLATHVVCISIGYAGCCASGLLGHIYLLQALRREPSDPVLLETFRAVYGAQAFGLIFSFLGTMLGGVWADQSWGRFWGWDPKENGALVIVLWLALLFHARLARLIGPRGFAAGAVLGVIGVLLAWLGVNLLGVGLHSYGFTSGIARGLFIACVVEVAFVAATVPFARRPPAAPARSQGEPG